MGADSSDVITTAELNLLVSELSIAIETVQAGLESLLIRGPGPVWQEELRALQVLATAAADAVGALSANVRALTPRGA